MKPKIPESNFHSKSFAKSFPVRPASLMSRAVSIAFAASLAASLTTVPVLAQTNPAATPVAEPDSAQPNGPVRLARFSLLSGSVTWRAAGESEWTSGALNMPLRQGAQIWTSDGSRAEIQFDDGSRVRLDSNTLITLQTMYSDAEGEFTEISLNDGEVALRLNNKYSLYQVNTAISSLKASGPARVRVGSGEGAQYGVKSGTAVVEGQADKVTLNSGEYVDVLDGNAQYDVQRMPASDAWDRFNDQRDHEIDVATARANEHLPANIGLVADDLDAYGSWHNDAEYGWIWAPRVSGADWRPYSSGRWTYVEPFGWTWVAVEPWGWAPYHYGTWISRPYGWGWVPGPRTQYWSPAVVSFYSSGASVAWAPLAPREVRYPTTLAVGFRGGDWSAFFSIGGAAVYYPNEQHIAIAQPWSSRYVNRVSYVRNVSNTTIINNTTIVRNVTVNQNTFINNSRFVPANAQAFGGTQTTVQSFGNGAQYTAVTKTQLDVFRNGQAVGAPRGQGFAVAGPQNVAVTRASLTPSRTFTQATTEQRQIARQSVYRGAAPTRIPVTPAVHGQQFSNMPRTARGDAPSTPGRAGAATGRPTFDGTRPGGADGGKSDSALDRYLRERNSSRGGSTPTPRSGDSPSRETGRETTPGKGSSTPDRETPARTTPNSGSREKTSTDRSGGVGSTYRELHTRRGSGSDKRDSSDHSRGGGGGGGRRP